MVWDDLKTGRAHNERAYVSTKAPTTHKEGLEPDSQPTDIHNNESTHPKGPSYDNQPTDNQ